MLQVSIFINFDIERSHSNLDTLRRSKTDCFDELFLISMNILNSSMLFHVFGGHRAPISIFEFRTRTLKRALISKELVLSENKSNTDPDLLLTSKQTGSWPKYCLNISTASDLN